MPNRPALVVLARPVPVNVLRLKIGVMVVEVEMLHALIVAFGMVEVAEIG
jgi:hypothetical protein